MSRKLTTIVMTIAVSLGLLFAVGCESDAQTGGLIGSAAGAGIGQAIGHDTTSTILGGVAGGAIGYGVGNERDKKKAAADREQIRAEMCTVTVWITNSNGSKVPVKLARQGAGYVGPRGEYYENMPTEDQLRPVYGF